MIWVEFALMMAAAFLACGMLALTGCDLLLRERARAERRERRDRERRWRAPRDAAWQHRAREAQLALELAVRKADGRLLRALGINLDRDTA